MERNGGRKRFLQQIEPRETRRCDAEEPRAVRGDKRSVLALQSQFDRGGPDGSGGFLAARRWDRRFRRGLGRWGWRCRRLGGRGGQFGDWSWRRGRAAARAAGAAVATATASGPIRGLAVRRLTASRS